jgi:hypothetical protein
MEKDVFNDDPMNVLSTLHSMIGGESNLLNTLKSKMEISLKSTSAEVLLFLFPLIEKLIIDSLSLIDGVDIEVYSQGLYRTLKSVLDKNDLDGIEEFPKQLVDELSYFFIDGEAVALRNNIVHTTELNKVSLDDIQRVKKLALQIMLSYELIRVRRENDLDNPIELLEE